MALRIDPLACQESQAIWFPGKGCGDLLNPNHALFLLDIIQSGKTIGGFASPPCRTLSKARHVHFSRHGYGPRPYRKHDQVWEPREDCSKHEHLSVMIESTLYLLCLGLLGEIRAQGGWVGLAHPADPGRHVASFFRSVEVRLRQFCNVFGMSYAEVDQCNFRAVHRKPLGLLLPTPCAMKHVKRIHGRKHHSRRSPILHDRSDGGGSPKYPSGLCHALATNFVERAVSVKIKGYSRPFKPAGHQLASGTKDPWLGLHHVQWQWVEPGSGVLAKNLATLNQRQIYSGSRTPPH